MEDISAPLLIKIEGDIWTPYPDDPFDPGERSLWLLEEFIEHGGAGTEESDGLYFFNINDIGEDESYVSFDPVPASMQEAMEKRVKRIDEIIAESDASAEDVKKWHILEWSIWLGALAGTVYLYRKGHLTK